MGADSKRTTVDVGEISASPAALRALHLAGGSNWLDYAERHASGDWGEVSAHERELNDAGARTAGFLRSRYVLRSGAVLLIETEGDRSATRLTLAGDDGRCSHAPPLLTGEDG